MNMTWECQVSCFWIQVLHIDWKFEKELNISNSIFENLTIFYSVLFESLTIFHPVLLGWEKSCECYWYLSFGYGSKILCVLVRLWTQKVIILYLNACLCVVYQQKHLWFVLDMTRLFVQTYCCDSIYRCAIAHAYFDGMVFLCGFRETLLDQPNYFHHMLRNLVFCITKLWSV
jgi:hypothetical protein